MEVDRHLSGGFLDVLVHGQDIAIPIRRYRTCHPKAPAAILLGSVGPGLTASALAAATRRVRIPMAGGVDSLNIAAAAAIAYYAFSRR